jgi:hypothetical protein
MEAAQWREIQKFVPERPFAGHLASPMEGGGRDVSVSYFVGWQEWQDSITPVKSKGATENAP